MVDTVIQTQAQIAAAIAALYPIPGGSPTAAQIIVPLTSRLIVSGVGLARGNRVVMVADNIISSDPNYVLLGELNALTPISLVQVVFSYYTLTTGGPTFEFGHYPIVSHARSWERWAVRSVKEVSDVTQPKFYFLYPTRDYTHTSF